MAERFHKLREHFRVNLPKYLISSFFVVSIGATIFNSYIAREASKPRVESTLIYSNDSTGEISRDSESFPRAQRAIAELQRYNLEMQKYFSNSVEEAKSDLEISPSPRPLPSHLSPHLFPIPYSKRSSPSLIEGTNSQDSR